MLLTVDVGNTNISCGIIDGNEIKATFRYTTNVPRTPDEFVSLFLSSMSNNKLTVDQVDGAIISSVVPSVNNSLKQAVESCFSVKPLMVASGIKTGLMINTPDPKSVGADLIVDSVAAYDIYKNECIIVDFGTATKFLYVNNKCTFTYCIIAPGLGGYANSLFANAAKLPEVEISKPASILTNTTVECMQAGISYGYIGLTNGILEQMIKELGREMPVISTGGLGKFMSDEVKRIDRYEPNLSVYGMKIIYDKNQK